ncbi:DUF654-domain-containing protein [Trichocladium antarcticum]|uniref:DUF654-domain-containing protein n=1 Tax=Trichocladium antarcticum TaxID=1450529 RepID=A0AAN6UI57_9PEZI|nr:DUF654-domain-containing protein [Trichocladium antarcticum]
MASRQLRKLRKQQELLDLENEDVEKSEESDDGHVVAKPRGNMFSGFAALGDMGDGADEDDDEAQKSDDDEPIQATTQQEPAGGQRELPKKNKKPKKKKKKGKQTGLPAPAKDERGSIDDIDRVLEELKLEAQKQSGSSAGPPAADKPTNELSGLLRINFQHLKAVNEMRRLFGKAMEAAEVEERPQEPRQRGLPQNIDLETFLSASAVHPTQHGRKQPRGMFDTILRTNPFIEGKKTWPRGSAQGLKMVRIAESPQGEVEFAFAHDQTYDGLEGSFFGLVQMYDPMQIVYFLHRYPYHISSLIQVSKVARQDQNTALAADLIERALFSFGRASLSEFRKNLETGTARMDFARPENRQFYLAGHNLIQKLVLKGTYRTALEWAKLFLSIDHSDPYAMMHWIHVLAIRAREAQWFINLCNSNTLPPRNTLHANQTLPLAYLQVDDPATAKTTLINNIETLPWLYCALFSALGLDAPPSIWGAQPRTDDETLHAQLYIHTAKDLWNTPRSVAVLQEAAAAAAKPSPDPVALPPTPPVDFPTARFVYLDNTPALMSAVPRQMLHTDPNFDFDPLPPCKRGNIFSSATQQLPWNLVEYGARRGSITAEVERLLAGMRPEQREELLRLGEVEGGGEVAVPAPAGLMNFLRNILMPPPAPVGLGVGGPEEGVDPDIRLPGSWEDDWSDRELEFDEVDELEGRGVDGEGQGDAQRRL